MDDTEQRWPSPRTREMFDAWFDVELCHSVYDLDPGDPFTQREVDAHDIAEALTTCASCGISVDEGEGRFAGFQVADPERLAPWKGRVLPLAIDEQQLIRASSRPTMTTSSMLRTISWSASAAAAARRVSATSCRKALRRLFRPTAADNE